MRQQLYTRSQSAVGEEVPMELRESGRANFVALRQAREAGGRGDIDIASVRNV